MAPTSSLRKPSKPIDPLAVRPINERPLRTGDIHSVDNDIRCLTVTSGQRSVRFVDGNVPATTIIARAMANLEKLNTLATEKATEDEVDPCLLPYYRKLQNEGKPPLNSKSYWYRAVTLQLLRDNLPDQPKTVLQLFTHWIAFFSDVDAVLDEEKTGGKKTAKTLSRLTKLEQAPRLRDPELRTPLMAVMSGLNGFHWHSVTSEDENHFKPDPAIVDFVRHTRIAPVSSTFTSEQKSTHLARLLSRICRIGTDPSSPAVAAHFAKTMAQMKAAASETAVVDIEDQLTTVAAGICTETEPHCGECPVNSICNAYKDHRANDVFMKLFLSNPRFLSNSVAVACRDGQECLLCSQDPACPAAAYVVGRGVTVYPAWRPRLVRKHEAVVLIRDVKRSGCLFSRSGCNEDVVEVRKGKGEKRKKIAVSLQDAQVFDNKLLRLDFPTDLVPSSDAALTHLKGQLLAQFPGANFTIERHRQADYRQEDATTGTLRLVYVYALAVDQARSGGLGAEEKFSTLKPGEVQSSMLSREDWTVFQNFLFFDRSSSHGENSSRKKTSESDPGDAPRLQVLQEAYLKRFHTFPAPPAKGKT